LLTLVEVFGFETFVNVTLVEQCVDQRLVAFKECVLANHLDLNLLVPRTIADTVLFRAIENDRVEEVYHVLWDAENSLVTVDHLNQEILLDIDLSLVKGLELKLPILNSVAGRGVTERLYESPASAEDWWVRNVTPIVVLILKEAEVLTIFNLWSLCYAALRRYF